MQIKKDIKTLWQYLKKYRKNVYFIVFISLIASSISAVIPYIYGRLVDFATKFSSNINSILWILGLWLFLTLLSNWISRYSDKKGTVVAVNASNDLLLDLSGHILRLPIGFHKDKKMGEILQRIGRASDFFETIINQILFDFAPGILRVIAGIGILAYVEWRLAIAIFIVVVLYIIATLIKVKSIIKTQRTMNRSYEKGFGDLYNATYNVQVVKSSVAEKIEEKRSNRNFGIIAEKVTKFMSAWLSMSAWQQTIFGVGFVAIFGAGIILLRNGVISAGELIMFVGYISLVQQPIAQLANNYRTIKRGMAVINRAMKLKNIKTEKYEEGKELRDIKGEVEFKNVSFAYKKGKMILGDIDFRINPGEIVALVGKSGVGKSTLVDLLSRYYSPTKGRILIDGHDIEKVKLQSLRKYIAIVPQEISLFNDTIKNNIAYGKRNAGMRKIIEVTQAANAHEFIDKFPKKYKQIVGERGIKLSVGQKQRVAIARALLRDPRILILDEATSALDSVSEKLVQEALARLIKGRTTFIVAHRLSTIRHADKIFVFEKGRIVERGTHSELIAKQNGIYRKFYMMQSVFGDEVKA